MPESTVLVVLRQMLAADAARRVLLNARPRIEARAVDGGIDAIQYASVARHLDVLIIDEELVGLGGERIAAAIQKLHPEARIVLVSDLDGRDALIGALRLGAAGILPATVDGQRLVSTVRAVLSGDVPLYRQVMEDPDVAEHLISVFRGMQLAPGEHSLDDPFNRLTPREVAALDGVVRGMSNREIADRLCVTEQTVKNQMTVLLRKLAVPDRVQALLVAVQQGWTTAHRVDTAAAFH